MKNFYSSYILNFPILGPIEKWMSLLFWIVCPDNALSKKEYSFVYYYLVCKIQTRWKPHKISKSNFMHPNFKHASKLISNSIKGLHKRLGNSNSWCKPSIFSGSIKRATEAQFLSTLSGKKSVKKSGIISQKHNYPNMTLIYWWS